MWCGIDAKITSVNVTQIMNMNFYKKNMTANLYFLGRTKAVSLRVSFWSELSVKFIPRLHEQKLVPVWRTNQNNQNNNYGVHWIIPNTTSMRQQSSKSCQFRPEKRSHKAFTFHIDMRISIRYSYRDELVLAWDFVPLSCKRIQDSHREPGWTRTGFMKIPLGLVKCKNKVESYKSKAYDRLSPKTRDQRKHRGKMAAVGEHTDGKRGKKTKQQAWDGCGRRTPKNQQSCNGFRFLV